MSLKRFTKLSRDTSAQNQPPGTYPFGKNGIQDWIKESTMNEPGFLPSSAAIPYTPNGIIETDKHPVIFSTNNVNSAIGYYNEDTDTYQPILNDASLSFKLGFSTDRPITGQAQRNYKGNVVCAFTDKFLNPFYLDLDAPQLTQLADLLLFPTVLPPVVDTSIQSGGTLLPGAYYAGVKLLKKDGTETGYLVVSSPLVVNGTAGEVTDKALQIILNSLDSNYDFVQIALISKINGIISARQLINPIGISGTATVLITGAELTEDITIEEILTPMAAYTQVGTIGQLNDALYIGALTSRPRINMQKYTTLIRVKWTSKLLGVDPVYAPLASGKEKSFLHGEVYAFYIRYHTTSGIPTPAFPIPGPALSSGDIAASSIAASEGVTAQAFQVQDTIHAYDVASKTGYMGSWANSTEHYPDTPDFDGSAVGGRNLRGQPVVHHRMPTLRFCRQNLYSSEATYGQSKLDILGITLENVIIPSQYASQITGWEVFYAKRSIGNSTVLGQSLLLFGGRNKHETEFGASTYYSTAGNWNSEISYKQGDLKSILLDQSIVHFHSFDMLFNSPDIDPTYLDLQMKHRRINIPDTGGFIEDGSANGSNNAPMVYELDYIQAGLPTTSPSKTFKAVKNAKYVPNNISLGKWQNLGVERFFGCNLTNPEKLIPDGEIDMQNINPGSRHSFTPPGDAVHQETTFLTNLCALRTNLFVPFNGQTLVRAGRASSLSASDVFYGGDTYISDYSFHTYGWEVYDQTQDTVGLYKGTKVVRRFICETASNLYSRFEIPGNDYSRYYPKSPLVKDDPNNYLTKFIRDKDPNQFGYTKDSNAQDDLVSSSIFNTFAEDITDHPYRIHRGGKLSRQTKFRSWRTFLPLDYYETQKNMGRIVHLEGMDDHLLIHHENALFLTQDKTKLESDVLSITLGAGDIFQFQPQEANSAKLGYAGTQHELACVRTPVGYVFIDSKAGQVFLYKGKLQLLNSNLNTFFKSFLRLKETNVFTGNGYTIGYDSTYKRFLLTAKNRSLSSGISAALYNPALIGTLTPGDIVTKNGRLQRFLGVNATSYNCAADLVPMPNNLTLTIAETSVLGATIGTVTGTNVDDYYFTAPSAPFTLDAATGNLRLTGALNYYQKNLYVFGGSAVNRNGNTAPFTVTINITQVNQAPAAVGGEVTIQDSAISGSTVFGIVATDRESDPLSYAITSGNTSATFAINATTGVITVADGSLLDGINIPRYTLTVSVSDTTHSVQVDVIIHVLHINQPPQVHDYSVTIDDETPSGAVILTPDPAIDRENDAITYTLVNASNPGVFAFDPVSRNISLISNASLAPATQSVYTLIISASDNVGMHAPVNFNVTINVIYSRKNLAFSAFQQTCIGTPPTCAAGYTLSADQSTCTKVTTTAPTITQLNSCLAPSTNGAYGTYGMRIYKPAFVNSDIGTNPASGTAAYAAVTSSYWMGVPNNIGVWVDTNCDGTKDGFAVGAQTTIFYNWTNTGVARTIYVAVFGDNQFELKVNGVSIAATTSPTNDVNLKMLHIFPVAVTNGQNLFNVVGTGDGTINDACGLAIYDNTVADLQAATSDSMLNIIFTSAALRGTSTTIATCPTGYVLDIVAGAPICKKIEQSAPITSGATTAHWAKVKITDIKRTAQIILLNNDGTLRFFQDISIPYYTDVANSIDCSGSVVAYYNAAQSGNAQKNNCVDSTGSVVLYMVPAGLYRSLSSQADADSVAINDVTAHKQSYANANGTCS